jgi:DNA-binding transcriptional ArsR family regulator
MNAFIALAEPTRLHIFELLAEHERPAGEIVKQFNITAPAISQHLQVLKEAGLVQVRAQGQRRIYSIKEDGLSEIEQWAKAQRAHWAKNLDNLERHLDETYNKEQ